MCFFTQPLGTKRESNVNPKSIKASDSKILYKMIYKTSPIFFSVFLLFLVEESHLLTPCLSSPFVSSFNSLGTCAKDSTIEDKALYFNDSERKPSKSFGVNLPLQSRHSLKPLQSSQLFVTREASPRDFIQVSLFLLHAC